MDTGKTCYLFFDYDGTVKQHGTISEETVKAMQAAQKNGHKLILNTGRSRAAVPIAETESCGIRWDGTICGGADIQYGDLHRSTTLPAEYGVKWVSYCAKYRYRVVLECEKENKDYRFSEEKQNGWLKRAKIRKEARAFLQDNPMTKLSLYIAFPLKHYPKKYGYLLDQGRYQELYQNGTDKGTVIKKFCELTGADLSQCACFGDSGNDKAMFETVPTSVAMVHSPDMLKRLATIVAETEDGVAEGMKKLFGDTLYV